MKTSFLLLLAMPAVAASPLRLAPPAARAAAARGIAPKAGVLPVLAAPLVAAAQASPAAPLAALAHARAPLAPAAADKPALRQLEELAKQGIPAAEVVKKEGYWTGMVAFEAPHWNEPTLAVRFANSDDARRWQGGLPAKIDGLKVHLDESQAADLRNANEAAEAAATLKAARTELARLGITGAEISLIPARMRRTIEGDDAGMEPARLSVAFAAVEDAARRRGALPRILAGLRVELDAGQSAEIAEAEKKDEDSAIIAAAHAELARLGIREAKISVIPSYMSRTIEGDDAGMEPARLRVVFGSEADRARWLVASKPPRWKFWSSAGRLAGLDVVDSVR